MIDLERYAYELVLETGITEDPLLLHYHSEKVLKSFLDFVVLKLEHSLGQIKEDIELGMLEGGMVRYLNNEVDNGAQKYLIPLMEEYAETYLLNADHARELINHN